MVMSTGAIPLKTTRRKRLKMIQRIQTLYLLLAVAVVVACLCLPVGTVEPAGMGVSAVLYNLGLYGANGLAACPVLFADLVVLAALSLVTVFLYRRRALQMKLCVAGVVLCLVWYVYYAYCAFVSLSVGGAVFHVRFAACLPFVALVLLLMARRGVKADDRLVRSMDRIR